MSDSLASWLHSANLSHLLPRLRAAGITESTFPQLTLADIDSLGLAALDAAPAGRGGSDRQRLFKLLQVVRAESEREAEQNAQAQATMMANSVSHAQARADRQNSGGGRANTASAAASSGGPHDPAASNFGLRSFFDPRAQQRNTAGLAANGAYGTPSSSGSARASPSSTPPQRTLAPHILKEQREYISLPIRAANTILSPARTFETPTSSPQRPQQQQQVSQPSFHQLSPRAAAILAARPTSPSSYGASAAIAAPRTLAWESPARSSVPTSVAASPARSASAATLASYQPNQLAFQPRSIPASPSAAHAYRPANVVAPSTPVSARQTQPSSSSPISPRSSAALYAAHEALERERERQRDDRAQDRQSAIQRVEARSPPSSARFRQAVAGAAASPFRPASAGAQQSHPTPAHHRTLFSEQPEGQMDLSYHSAATPANLVQKHTALLHAQQQQQQQSHLQQQQQQQQQQRNIPAPRSSPYVPPLRGLSSPSRGGSGLSVNASLHPLEAGDYLADDAALARLLQSEEDLALEVSEGEESEDVPSEDDGGEEEDEGASFVAPPLAASSSSSLASSSSAFSHGARIRVAVRKRPLNARERARGESDITSVSSSSASVSVHEPKVKVDLTRFVESHSFHFDSAFSEHASTREIYTSLCRPLVAHVMAAKGGRASCFAYGQTGAGKTFTLMGPQGGKQEQSGLYMLAAEDLFATIRQRQREEAMAMAAAASPSGAAAPSAPTSALRWAHCALYVSYFEIYSGKLFDLLHGRRRLVCRADAQQVVHVVGLKEQRVRDVQALLRLITEGNAARSTGQTGANLDSSRSHAILAISLRQVVPIDPAQSSRRRPSLHPESASALGASGELDPHSSPTMLLNLGAGSSSSALGAPVSSRRFRLQTRGKLSFIDLAGSERGVDTTDNDPRTRMEGREINKSLLALKECIRALDQGGQQARVNGLSQAGGSGSSRHVHTPFRGSILTQVLKDSFVGACRTLMIAAVAPGSGSAEHTLNTLRYADRVKSIRRGEAISSANGVGASAAAGSLAAAAAAGAQPKSARGAASAAADLNLSSCSSADAYMPHTGRRLHTRITLLPPEPNPAQRERRDSVSGANSLASSPARPLSARGAAASSAASNSLHPSASMGQLRSAHASPASARGARGSAGSQASYSSAAPASASASASSLSASSLSSQHSSLLSRLSSAESALVSAHRSSVDARMSELQEEMAMLRKLEDGRCSAREYAQQLRGRAQAQQSRAVGLARHIDDNEQMRAEAEELARKIRSLG